MNSQASTDWYYEGQDLEVLADMPNYQGWIMDYFAPHVRGHVIEYGAGTGTFSEQFASLAKTLTLVEPSPNLADRLRTRFASNSSIVIERQSLEAHVSKVRAGSIDTVAMINVLEHIERDDEAIENLLNILKPDGKLLIFVPALNALMSKLDLLLGHHRRYHRGDLVSKVERAGGQVMFCRYFDLPGMLAWFVFNKVLRSETFNPAIIRLNERVVVPLARLVEQTISPPIGKNIVLIASR